MATVRYIGKAAAVAQVDTFTPADVEIGDIFTLTVTGLAGTSFAVSFTATVATVANVTAGLTAAWNAATDALCTPITAADNTTNLTLTADTAGVAFTVASTAVNGGATDDQTLARAATTKNEGPSDWSSVDNWDSGAVPGNAASQDVYIENTSNDLLYGLDQSGISNILTALNIDKSFTGELGVHGATGESGTYLQIKAAKINIGEHNGPGSPVGSGLIKIDSVSTVSVIVVHDTASVASDTSKPAVLLKTNHTSTTVEVIKGKVGVAYEPGESALLGTIYVGYKTSIETDAEVYTGAGATIAAIYKHGGKLYLASGTVTVKNWAGDFYAVGEALISGSTYAYGGTCYLNGDGPYGTLFILDQGVVDFTQSNQPRTVTTVNLDAGGSLRYHPDYITITNKVDSAKPVELNASAA